MKLPDAALPILDRVDGGRVVFLTGAGISAESGIPTFRGEEGYWTVGSKEYHPQEMATQAMFQRAPDEVWRWYLYRLGVCRGAAPNAAHAAVASVEEQLGDRFCLITQNVDGLHLRAGNSLDRTCQVHGNIELHRCVDRCSAALHRMPPDFAPRDRDAPLSADDRQRLACPDCGGRTRPHVLWFDEYYEEELYRSETAMHAAATCDLLVIVGTAGATSLPVHAARVAARAGAGVIDVNLDANPFAEIAHELTNGLAIEGRAGEVVPALAARLR
ncbi:MAG: Sir2 family NAD-dependent protein deacetylase [Planctomycetota bacterium]